MHSRSDCERSRASAQEHEAIGETEGQSPKSDPGVQKYILRVQVRLLAKINSPKVEFKGLRPVAILRSARKACRRHLELVERCKVELAGFSRACDSVRHVKIRECMDRRGAPLPVIGACIRDMRSMRMVFKHGLYASII